MPASKAPANSASDVVLERLSRLHPKVIDLSLGRIERLLAKLGHPERQLAPVVHVAGTNGKGSTVAFLRAMLEAAGYRVHVYTSPHLARFHERIRLAGKLIAEADLLAILEECETANGTEPITFFEITTAAAFVAFARQPADVVLLETGLGGRLDATNLIAKPLLTAITPVSLDHQAFLGNTLAAIAKEKAGIIKRDVPCVLARQEPEAEKIFAKSAANLCSPLMREGQEWSCRLSEGNLRFTWHKDVTILPRPALAGIHQAQNAGTALACIRTMSGFTVGAEAEAKGLLKATWPARLQRLGKGPLARRLPEKWELYLDGGHNPSAGRALGEHARGWADAPLFLIVGMLDNRPVGEFLSPLAGQAAGVTGVPIPGSHASHPAEAVAAAARRLRLPATTAKDVATALKDIVAQQQAARPDQPARVLICGSLYLAGDVLARGNG